MNGWMDRDGQLQRVRAYSHGMQMLCTQRTVCSAADEDRVLRQAVRGENDAAALVGGGAGGRGAMLQPKGAEGGHEGVEAGAVHGLGGVDHVPHAGEVKDRLWGLDKT